MFNNQILAGSSGQGGITQQSLKFNDDESQYLSWTPAAAGNRRTWTWSAWVKRGNIGTTQDIFIAGSNASGQLSTQFTITSGNILQVYSTISGSSAAILLQTTQVFRDPSAWYHFTLTANTTDGTASNRVKLYVNGEQVTSFSTATYPSQNYDTAINNNVIHTLGRFSVAAANHFDGYLSDVYFIDGQALDPTDFGQFTDGYWEAIDYAGSYGTNGFHLTFADDVVSEGFNAVTYRGTGASQSVSGLGLEADFVWLKHRNGTSYHHLFDSVRGSNSRLFSNLTDAEGTTNPSLFSFDSDGFSLSTNGDVNGSGNSYVAWAWDAGSGSPVSNTDGSITSTVKASQANGFSIVTWTGDGSGSPSTLGHGLGTAPSMVITKGRDTNSSGGPGAFAANDWLTYHVSLGNAQVIALNSTFAASASANMWDSTSPTATVFSIGALNSVNQTGNGYVAYCFAEVANYSSIGTYSGNGSTSGPTVTTGFAPAFVMVKRTDNTGSWFIVDNTRDPRSSPTKDLQPNSSGAETDNPAFYTFTSTGFQLKTTGTAVNASGGTYIYMAFADTRDAAFWRDVSGNNNNWTPNNLDYRDSLPDSPTNNFATFNPIDKNDGTYSEGNLKAVTGTVGGSTQRGSFYFNNGKWYYEFLPTINGGITALGFESLNGGVYTPHFYQADNGQYYNGASASAYGATFTTLDVIGVALDADNQTVEFFKNGASQGLISSVNSGMTAGDEYVVHLTDRDVAQTLTGVINFGQDSTFSGERPAGGNTDANNIGNFAYAVPSGFLSLCSDNLPEVTVGPNSAAKPIDQFETILYTGNGGTQHIGSGGVQHPVDVTTIDNSLRFNDDDSAYLARTPASAGNRKTWTWSGWVKRGNFSQNFLFSAGADSNNRVQLSFEDYTSDNLSLEAKSGGSTQALIVSTATYRDPSAWYHVVIAVDTTEATSTDRIKFYVDGSQVTDLQQTTYPSQNADLEINKAIEHNIGKRTYSTNYYDGYMADVYFIDGQALTPSSFGQYGSNGYWIPKAVTGLTYGTNGFSLDFSDNSTAAALGTDGSGNSNDWTPSNIGVSDQMLDSPTQNYATLDALQTYSTVTLSEGNLKSFSNDAARLAISEVTYGLTSGKYYFEYSQRAGSNVGYPIIFINDSTSADYTDTGYSGYGVNAYGEYILDGTNVARVASLSLDATSDVRMFAIDFDNGKIWAGKNGTWYDQGGTSYTNATGPESGSNEIAAGFDYNLAKIFVGHNDSGSTGMFNFGADSTFAGNKTAASNADDNGYGNFQYAPPSGFLALVNDNIPEERGINSPDLVWIKTRNTASQHVLTDSVRGVSKQLFSSLTNAETTEAGKGVISFDYDGFTLGPELSVTGSTNNGTYTYASWNWKAGGTAVANTDGSIASQVSANTDAGFSIVSYTGTGANATVGHSLGVQPSMIIVKNRDTATWWDIYHGTLGGTKYLRLNSTNGEFTGSVVWNDTDPTSSVFSVGTVNDVNASGENYIAYCFANSEGFSKAGSYTGNGSTNGTFVYTGFRPAWIMVKNASVSNSWRLWDSERPGYNLTNLYLTPDSSGSEGAINIDVDLTSNGFKLRGSNSSINGSGNTIIYLAFAENPFKYANAR